ncbi:hypothetical protein QD47_22995 [Paenibacillus terrae]|uniref:Uncharacterized protein n=1 Tax=Paenibacillus terrae TaxID=159743 RepID=A0A0D7WWM9_9BACL|nr:hypothetical protein QD47_22995 [Paenibacillus terrae]
MNSKNENGLWKLFLLYKMKSQYLRYAQLPNEEFIKMYVANLVVHMKRLLSISGSTYSGKVTKKTIKPLKHVGICTKVL